MFTSDGRGYFIRAADGTTRTLGSVQNDAIREIEGVLNTYQAKSKSDSLTGVFAVNAVKLANTGFSSVSNASTEFVASDFKASRAVPTAAENRPVNIGFEPCIYLDLAA
jgi:hypothetical protein